MIIDAHAHVGSWREPGFASRTTSFDDAVALYGALDFQGALVMPTDTGDNAALLASVKAHEGTPQFRFAYWIDPNAANNLAAFDACSSDVAALKVHPSFLRRPITDADFEPFFERAVALGLPVVVHCGRWREVAGFSLALDVAEHFPDLNIVLSHMGGDEPLLVRETVAAIQERALTNVFLGTESLRQYWVVQEALDALGSRRLVFGSDYNLNYPAAFLAVIRALDVDEVGRQRILGGNLNKLLPRAHRFEQGSVAS